MALHCKYVYQLLTFDVRYHQITSIIFGFCPVTRKWLSFSIECSVRMIRNMTIFVKVWMLTIWSWDGVWGMGARGSLVFQLSITTCRFHHLSNQRQKWVDLFGSFWNRNAAELMDFIIFSAEESVTCFVDTGILVWYLFYLGLLILLLHHLTYSQFGIQGTLLCCIA